MGAAVTQNMPETPARVSRLNKWAGARWGEMGRESEMLDGWPDEWREGALEECMGTSPESGRPSRSSLLGERESPIAINTSSAKPARLHTHTRTESRRGDTHPPGHDCEQ